MSPTFRIEPFWRVILREFDLSAELLARRAGLPANFFAADPAMVDVDGWAALWDALAAEVDTPDLPLQLGRCLTLDMFDPALFAALCSAHLEQAATRLQLYKRLVGPCRLRLERKEGLALACEVEGLPHPPQLWGAGELVMWVALVRHTTRHRVVPRSVTMPIAPRAPAAFEDYFGAPVTHGPQYELLFHEEDVRRAFLTTDAAMWTFFEPMLARRLAELDERTSMVERVCVVLLELLPSGRTQIRDVAQALGASVRTVQRRLERESTTYREVLDRTRARLARHYLTRTRLTTAEVAFLIGYEDSNSLYSAFRAWTGTTPQAVRDAARIPD